MWCSYCHYGAEAAKLVIGQVCPGCRRRFAYGRILFDNPFPKNPTTMGKGARSGRDEDRPRKRMKATRETVLLDMEKARAVRESQEIDEILVKEVLES